MMWCGAGPARNVRHDLIHPGRDMEWIGIDLSRACNYFKEGIVAVVGGRGGCGGRVRAHGRVVLFPDIGAAVACRWESLP
eukprot:gene10578-biopygen7149